MVYPVNVTNHVKEKQRNLRQKRNLPSAIYMDINLEGGQNEASGD